MLPQAGTRAHSCGRYLDPRDVAWVELPQALFGAPLVAIAIAALALVGMTAGGWQVAMLAAWALIPPAVTFLASDIVSLFLPRYFLFTLPAWVVLAANGVALLATRLASQRPLAALTALGMLFLGPSRCSDC